MQKGAKFICVTTSFYAAAYPCCDNMQKGAKFICVTTVTISCAFHKFMRFCPVFLDKVRKSSYNITCEICPETTSPGGRTLSCGQF